MKRREVLSIGGGVMWSLIAGRPSFAQVNNRGAVVIGVNRIDGMQPLSASQGAKSVAAWLSSEGFEVKTHIDENSPVTVSAIKASVGEFVARGTLQMLVIYFAGHGFLSGSSEWWMLSNAPADPDEAISLIESSMLAKDAGIPNVVFISDACRSTPDSLRASRVDGSIIFPNTGASHNSADVDKFLATHAGSNSYELPVDDGKGTEFQGIFTASFLEAFQNPEAEMVKVLSDGTKVVTNRSLKSYLRREVSRRAQAKSISLRQLPDVEVVSTDETYIARVTTTTRSQPPTLESEKPAISEIVDEELRRADAKFNNGTLVASLDANPYYEKFDSNKDIILSARAPSSFESQTGFSVSGATVVEVVAGPDSRAQILNRGDRIASPASIRLVLDPNAHGETVGIRFSDGSGTVAAALAGFIGNIVVTDGRVGNISYVPSRNSDRWPEYSSEHDRLNKLHAIVASAAGLGGFRIEGDRNTRAERASQMANDIRVLKSIDPTLGVYAAYAYADAALPQQVDSVAEFMASDLRVNLFDVALLNRELSGERIARTDRVVPIVPMLSQGWELLRVLNVRSEIDLARLKQHLRPALWTTFTPEGFDLVQTPVAQQRFRVH